MYKKIIVISFFFLTAFKVHAVSTSYYSPSSVGASSSFINTQEAYTSDNIYSTYSYGGSGSIYWQANNFGFNVPLNASITSIDVEVEGYIVDPQPSNSIKDLLISIQKEGTTNFYGNVSGGCNTPRTLSLSGTDTTYNKNLLSTCFANSSLITPSNINDNLFSVRLDISANGTTNYYIDRVRVRINYDLQNPGLYIDSAVASVSGQFVNLSLSGSTSTTSSTMQCDISLFERCSRSGFAGWTSQTPVAHVKLDATYGGATTQDMGQGYYKAHGWGGNDTTWSAENIQVPYNAGYSCDYPVSYYCTENRQIVLQDNFSQNNSLVATPSGNLTGTLYTEPEPTNPLSWVVWKIEQIFWKIFGFNGTTNMQYFALIKEEYESKAPFAYANAVFSLDFTTTPISTSAPVINIALAHTEGILPSEINWVAPPVFYQFIGIFRPIVVIFLWLIFVGYLYLLSRRIFK